MKKIVLLLFLPLISLFALTQNDEMAIYVKSIEANTNDTVFVDCSYVPNTKIFNLATEGKYNSLKAQEMLNKLCSAKKDNKNETPLFVIATVEEVFEAYNSVKDDYPRHNYELSLFYSYFDYRNAFLEADSFDMNNIKENFEPLRLSYFFTNFALELPIAKLSSNREITFKIEHTLPEEDEEEKTFVLTNYSYNKDTNKVEALEFQEPLKIESIEYTNTYDMDRLRDCIDNKVWIKKYGKMSGDECPWLEKSKAQEVKFQ